MALSLCARPNVIYTVEAIWETRGHGLRKHNQSLNLSPFEPSFSLRLFEWSRARAKTCLIFQKRGSPFNLIKTFFFFFFFHPLKRIFKKCFKVQITWALLLAVPEPLSAWKYLLWTPALPSTQHRQLWELFKQERSTDRRRLIWRDEGIRKWNLHWCAEGMEREFPQALWGWLHFSWAFCAYAKDCCICVAFTCLNFFVVCVYMRERERAKERNLCVRMFSRMSCRIWVFGVG